MIQILHFLLAVSGPQFVVMNIINKLLTLLSVTILFVKFHLRLHLLLLLLLLSLDCLFQIIIFIEKLKLYHLIS